MTHRLAGLALLATFVWIPPASVAAEEPRPNVVFILADEKN